VDFGETKYNRYGKIRLIFNAASSKKWNKREGN
jgi:hypothetical protein